VAKHSDAFDAVGVVRRFKEEVRDGAVRIMFDLEIGNIIVPCHSKVRFARPPINGESARVLGDWLIDENRHVCVAVRVVYPARYDAADACARAAGGSM
jgi:hypothetical protein